MKNINLREVLVTLSESEMKKVAGGGDFELDRSIEPKHPVCKLTYQGGLVKYSDYCLISHSNKWIIILIV